MIGIGNDAVAQNINIGTGAAARTITVGNNSGATTLNFTSGTGAQTFTSSAATTGAFAFVADSITTATAIDLSVDAITEGVGVNISNAANTLTTGTLLNVDSTSTAVTGSSTGLLGYFNWNPGSTTTATGDLFRINIGTNGNIDNLFNVTDNGSSLFRVSESQIESAVPHSFTAAGDVSIAYDIQFTNQTSSSIKSKAPLTIDVGESFESNDFTVTTYNSGQIVYNLDAVNHVIFSPVADADAGTTTSIQEIAFSSPVDTTGTNTHNALNLDLEIGNASAGTNTVNGLAIDAISGDADVSLNAIDIGALTGTTATEYAINIASGWDRAINANSPVQFESSAAFGTQVTLADDATPDVSAGSSFITGGTTTITDFDAGSGTLETGQLIFIEAAHSVTFDVTASGLVGGTTDIAATSGDFLTWQYDGTDWHLVSFKDNDTDQGGGSAGAFSSSGGVITKSTSTDQLNLSSDEAGDYALLGDASVAPTVDLIQLTNTGVGTVTNDVDILSASIYTATGGRNQQFSYSRNNWKRPS